MNFKHELPALEIDMLSFPMELANEDCEGVHSDATIRFSVNIESRDYGIKSIYTYTESIEMLINDLEFILRPDEPCTIDGVADDTWEVRDNLDLSNLSIVPDRVELDWKTKIAYVYYL